MLKTQRAQTSGSGPTLLAVLLLVMVLILVLAREARVADETHRRAAMEVLRNYGATAADRYALYAEDELASVLFLTLRPLRDANRGDGPDRFATPDELENYARAGKTCECESLDSVRYFFIADLERETLRTDRTLPTGVSSVSPAWLSAHARRTLPPDGQVAVMIESQGTPQRVIAYVLRRDSAGLPIRAYGFEASLADIVPHLAAVVNKRPLIQSLLTEDVPTASLLGVAVRDAAGKQIYRSTNEPVSRFRGEDTLRVQFGSLRVETWLRPETASQLIIGGLPPSRTPLLLGLLAIAAALLIVGVFLISRERELRRMQADFVSGVSHELRTPLAQIRMFAETLLLERARSEAERRRSLEIIDQEARRLTQLVENVLHLSRSERRIARVLPEPTELASQVREIVDTFAPLARARRMSVEVDVEERIAAPVDRGALRQILLNLLDNAVKYGPAGQTVAVGLALFGDRARLWVDDEGPGIPLDERERVFAPFRRLPAQAQASVAGCGIGLAVVRELVGLHGGRTWADEAPGGGARMVVELPGASILQAAHAGRVEGAGAVA